MKMILTRQGFNSKMVVTGDPTQVDLFGGQRSGLTEAVDVLRNVEGISFIQFDDRDVVRHNLVQKIVKAYERYNEIIGANRQLSLKLSDPALKISDPSLKISDEAVKLSEPAVEPVRSEVVPETRLA